MRLYLQCLACWYFHSYLRVRSSRFMEQTSLSLYPEKLAGARTLSLSWQEATNQGFYSGFRIPGHGMKYREKGVTHVAKRL